MSNRKRRLSALILLVEPIKKLLLAKKQRSTNIVVDDALDLLDWINKKIVSRGYNDSTHLTIMDCQTSVDLGISERRAKNAKALLKDVGAISFFKKTRSGDFWINLWTISIEFSRAVYVTNGYFRVGSESRYRSSEKKMSYDFVMEENNIFALVKDEAGTKSIFRKHLKVFKEQCQKVCERSASVRDRASEIKQSAYDFIDEFLNLHDETLICF